MTFSQKNEKSDIFPTLWVENIFSKKYCLISQILENDDLFEKRNHHTKHTPKEKEFYKKDMFHIKN